ncbi:hypothetical protein RvY_17382 [Ramazzottius varieornatus]|uniref:Uncharacterized protein n=1 Tax=Ramazzottius varieornatus TaxID=947166 RepID=A0A1D1W902_RAMVA|nr:hypothetical protein RvY_17382 [Ramazzottius varieornatus]
MVKILRARWERETIRTIKSAWMAKLIRKWMRKVETPLWMIHSSNDFCAPTTREELPTAPVEGAFSSASSGFVLGVSL